MADQPHAAPVPEYEAEYEGFWSRLNCGNCGNVFEVEGDVSPGEKVECDLCHVEQAVTGR